MRSLLWIPADDTRYVYGASLIRALEWTLLTRKTLDAMARAASPDEALEELGETAYAKHMAPGQRAADFEHILSGVLEETYALLKVLIVDRPLVRGMLWVHDMHNLKAILKASLAGTEPKGLVSFGTIDPGQIRAAVTSGEFGTLPPDIVRVVRAVRAAYQLTQDPRLLEVMVDTEALAERVRQLARVEDAVMQEYAARLADVTNLRTLVRVNRLALDSGLFEKAFIPGGMLGLEAVKAALGKGLQAIIETYARTVYAKAVMDGIAYLQERNSFAALDRELENMLVATLQGTRFVFFSPSPIIAFVLAREHEVSMVRLVMVAKINRIPSELIVARLSMLYG